MLAAQRRLNACNAELTRARNAIRANQLRLDIFAGRALDALPAAEQLRLALKDWREYERRLVLLRDRFESVVKRRENGKLR